MAKPNLEIDRVSVVLVGQFNPAIFQPMWLAAHHLVGPQEAEDATIQVVHPEVTQFRTSWFELQVTTSRFTVTTGDAAHHEPLRDLVIGVFELLRHTPAGRMGMNRDMHFKFAGRDALDNFGHVLAPKHAWDDVLPKAGMRKLTIEGQRSVLGRQLSVSVAPSVLVKNGVEIDVNDDYLPPEGTEPAGLEGLLVILRAEWEASQKASYAVATHLLHATGTKP
jgi:hypothetical protein